MQLRVALKRRAMPIATLLGLPVSALEAFATGAAKLPEKALEALPGALIEPPRRKAPPPVIETRGARFVLNARSLKAVVVLDPAELAAMADSAGQRVVLTINAGGRTLGADVASKSFRKARLAIAEHGVEGVAAIVQGKLVGDTISEAGLMVTVKERRA